MTLWQNNDVFFPLMEHLQQLISAFKRSLSSVFTKNHMLHYFAVRPISAFNDAAHMFLWFHTVTFFFGGGGGG